MISTENTLNNYSSNTRSTENKATQEDLVTRINRKLESGPSRKDILNFTNQLSVMIRAGISLQDSLEAIESQVENKKFKEMLLDIRSNIESGQNFSQSLAQYPKVFSNLYINMVAAAEISGSLSSMLDKLAEYLDQEAETRSQIIGAMVYPIILATMAISSTVFLLMFVLPRFLTVFEGKEDMLPAPTKIVMGLSSFMTNYWYVILIAIIGIVWGAIVYIKTPNGRGVWDKLKLRIPLIKTLCRNLYISRGLHTMGVLSNSGVPILDTLTITADISGNVHYKNMWKSVYESVRQGHKISSTLVQFDLLPGAVVQMIRSGEESGTLSSVLQDVAEYYARELKAIIKVVTSMLEPIMIVVMGSVVGFIAASIILPIFKMSSVLSK